MNTAIVVTPEEQAFVDAFEDGTLPASQFRHRDHIRLAWIYLRLYPVPAALARVVEGIKRFAAAQGAPGMYHETITYAFLFLINERMEHVGREAPWETFEANNADLITGGLGILQAYYQAETLASNRARAIFVMPDHALVGRAGVVQGTAGA